MAETDQWTNAHLDSRPAWDNSIPIGDILWRRLIAFLSKISKYYPPPHPHRECCLQCCCNTPFIFHLEEYLKTINILPHLFNLQLHALYHILHTKYYILFTINDILHTVLLTSTMYILNITYRTRYNMLRTTCFKLNITDYTVHYRLHITWIKKNVLYLIIHIVSILPSKHWPPPPPPTHTLCIFAHLPPAPSSLPPPPPSRTHSRNASA